VDNSLTVTLRPSVVPVCEAGPSPEGAPWLTTKRVRGQTLAEVNDRLAEGARR
jgi:hypothetical protein